jgi:hypothetical protein
MMPDAGIAEYRRAAQKAKTRVSLPLLVLGVFFFACESLRLPVPWWAVLGLLLSALGGGVIFPVVYRRRHHPMRLDARERRYTLAQLIGRSVGFVGIVGGFIALGLRTERASAVAPYLALFGCLCACVSVFFRYERS